MKKRTIILSSISLLLLLVTVFSDGIFNPSVSAVKSDKPVDVPNEIAASARVAVPLPREGSEVFQPMVEILENSETVFVELVTEGDPFVPEYVDLDILFSTDEDDSRAWRLAQYGRHQIVRYFHFSSGFMWHGGNGIGESDLGGENPDIGQPDLGDSGSIAVPEPSAYGFIGGTLILILIGFRRYRMRRN